MQFCDGNCNKSAVRAEQAYTWQLTLKPALLKVLPEVQKKLWSACLRGTANRVNTVLQDNESDDSGLPEASCQAR